ncbi:MAG: histidine phosphatase family protein [Myxococcales bacterium]|nr:histidine phosphatase family protein [Myxococcales bacterium]MCB9647401.1 histidine phosphatase family protein [Deltaproteobacteria bacterium]
MSGLRLVLMRHAKSAWDSGAPTDHARPLNRRGQRDAPRVGQALAERGWWPELALVSDAERTEATWRAMAQGQAPTAVQHHRRLYLAGVAELREILGLAPDSARTVLALGHNPGWEEALTWLSGADEPMKTACAALLSTDAEGWAAAVEAPGRFTLEAVIRPKALG